MMRMCSDERGGVGCGVMLEVVIKPGNRGSRPGI